MRLMCRLWCAAMLGILASSATAENYDVSVSKRSGRYEGENGVGFAFSNAQLSVDGRRLRGSMQLKVYNNVRTPITQVFITVGRGAMRSVFNRVPRGSNVEGYGRIYFSIDLGDLPMRRGNMKVNIIQTQARSEGAGRQDIQNGGGWVVDFGVLRKH